jgi:hypothetical protein
MRLKLVIALILSLAVLSQAQNKILIVSSQPDELGNIQELDKIIADLNYVAEYSDHIPIQLETYQYSLVILAEFEDADCDAIWEFLDNGGGIILVGRLPYDLLLNCVNRNEILDMLGFDSYQNGSGELKAAINLEMIDLPADSLLDRTPCEIGFGGLGAPDSNAIVMAVWQCPVKTQQIPAITMNLYRSGVVFYFSRLLSAVRVRALLGWAIDRSVQYRWGDADNSRRVNITDAVFIVRMIFGGGPIPEIPNACDANGDGSINISDAVWLINYIFVGGDPPRAGRVD